MLYLVYFSNPGFLGLYVLTILISSWSREIELLCLHENGVCMLGCVMGVHGKQASEIIIENSRNS